MKRNRSLSALVLFLGGPTLLASPAFAGFFEISANGSYFKYNNGLIGGEPSTTTITRFGGGIGYRLLANTSIEINYSESRNKDNFAQDIEGDSQKRFINKDTQVQNLSLDLVLNFADRRAPFRPYIKGGVGYMIRNTKLSGKEIDKDFGTETKLNFVKQPQLESASAEVGVGTKIMLDESLALDLGASAYFSDLDKKEIYIHQSYTGGIRIIF